MKQIKKDLQEIKKEVDEEKEEIGLATEIIRNNKEQLKRKDIIIILLIICWFITGSYLVYLLNDIGTAETTTTTETETYDQDIKDTGDIDNSTINNGGVINGTN